MHPFRTHDLPVVLLRTTAGLVMDISSAPAQCCHQGARRPAARSDWRHHNWGHH